MSTGGSPVFFRPSKTEKPLLNFGFGLCVQFCVMYVVCNKNGQLAVWLIRRGWVFKITEYKTYSIIYYFSYLFYFIYLFMLFIYYVFIYRFILCFYLFMYVCIYFMNLCIRYASVFVVRPAATYLFLEIYMLGMSFNRVSIWHFHYWNPIAGIQNRVFYAPFPGRWALLWQPGQLWTTSWQNTSQSMQKWFWHVSHSYLLDSLAPSARFFFVFAASSSALSSRAGTGGNAERQP